MTIRSRAVFFFVFVAAFFAATALRAQDTTNTGVRLGLSYQAGTKPGVIVLPVADRHLEYAREVQAGLDGLRVEVDDRTESIGRKIRDAELQKIPYMLVVGDREAEEGTVAVRRHGEGDEVTVALSEFVQRLAGEVAARS